jgi:hypothetical protein
MVSNGIHLLPTFHLKQRFGQGGMRPLPSSLISISKGIRARRIRIDLAPKSNGAEALGQGAKYGTKRLKK